MVCYAQCKCGEREREKADDPRVMKINSDCYSMPILARACLLAQSKADFRPPFFVSDGNRLRSLAQVPVNEEECPAVPRELEYFAGIER